MSFQKLEIPEDRKSSCHPSGQESLSDSQQKNSNRKYGTMPRLQNNIPNQIQRGPGIPFSTLNSNNIFARGESSIKRNSILYNFRFNPTTPTLTIH